MKKVYVVLAAAAVAGLVFVVQKIMTKKIENDTENEEVGI